ncbi:MAG: fumarylacetoacetate hydrolase family protein [Polyangiaceae bacterium]
MRIASVLHDASPEPDGAPLLPTLALERDGALYGVALLARAFGVRAPELTFAPDFHHVVVALRAAPLFDLDARLRSGERPTSARLRPGTFTWLPPCSPDRAAFFRCSSSPAPAPARPSRERPPSFAAGTPRTFLGHDSAVPLPLDPPAPIDVEASLAVLLADDLHRATAAEAHRAILGYTLHLAWSPGHLAQLGPVLVTLDELPHAPPPRTLLRIDGAAHPTAPLAAAPFTPAESIAWISQHIPLQAGDLISTGCLRAPAAPRPALTPGARVDFTIERLARLAGRPVEGPPLIPWRAQG